MNITNNSIMRRRRGAECSLPQIKLIEYKLCATVPQLSTCDARRCNKTILHSKIHKHCPTIQQLYTRGRHNNNARHKHGAYFWWKQLHWGITCTAWMNCLHRLAATAIHHLLLPPIVWPLKLSSFCDYRLIRSSAVVRASCHSGQCRTVPLQVADN